MNHEKKNQEPSDLESVDEFFLMMDNIYSQYEKYIELSKINKLDDDNVCVNNYSDRDINYPLTLVIE